MPSIKRDVMRRMLVLFLAIGGIHCSTAAQEATANQDSSSSTTPPPFNPVDRLGKDLWIQASSPFHMDKTNAYWVSAGLVTTAVLLITDQGTYNTVKDAEFDATWVSKASPVITKFGSAYGLGIVGAFAGYGFIAGDSKAKETAYLATESFLTSGLWGWAIKILTGRERPSVESEGGGEWGGPLAYFRKHNNRSISAFDAFPSGHTLTAFSIATVFSEQYSDNIVIPIVCYTAASLVGVSRITEDAHWMSDVFVGAILGHLTAQEVLANNPSEVSRRGDTSQRVSFGWSFGMLEGRPQVRVHIGF